MKKVALLLSIVVSCIASIALGEWILRLVAPVPDPYERYKGPGFNQYVASQFPPNSRFITTAEAGLPGVSGTNRFTTNNMGFRGDDLVRPKPSSEFRIFMVGGSSTECLFLDDRQAIHTVLQSAMSKLDRSGRTIKVYNAGKSGDRSDDHVSMIVHRIIHLEPDMIVVLAGLNDLRALIAGFDYLHFAQPGAEERPSVSLLVRVTATEFQLGRRVHYFLRARRPRRPREVLEEITWRSNYKERVRIRVNAPATNERPVFSTKPYGKNLATIAGLSRAHRIPLIYVTQQTTWNSRVDPRAEQWQWMLYLRGRTYRADIMDAALESVNDAMRQVAAEQAVPLYDLPKTMPKSTEFFYDDVHFNVKGARTAGEGLAAFIVSRRLTSLR